ncbi:MAG: hypothetical protein LC776_00125 [Acidobacteria bacterium]|nr:hypothetical protein [Acidobacteriota bacterium]
MIAHCTPHHRGRWSGRTPPGLAAAVEWANTHLKNWRILATRYRDNLHRFDSTIAAVTGLTLRNEQHSERQLTFTRLNKLKDVSEMTSLYPRGRICARGCDDRVQSKIRRCQALPFAFL